MCNFFFHKITRIYAVETEHNNGKTSTVTSGTNHYVKEVNFYYELQQH